MVFSSLRLRHPRARVSAFLSTVRPSPAPRSKHKQAQRMIAAIAASLLCALPGYVHRHHAELIARSLRRSCVGQGVWMGAPTHGVRARPAFVRACMRTRDCTCQRMGLYA